MIVKEVFRTLFEFEIYLGSEWEDLLGSSWVTVKR